MEFESSRSYAACSRLPQRRDDALGALRNRTARLARLIDKDGAGWRDFAADDQTAVHDLLARLASNKQSRLALAAESLTLRLESLAVTDEWEQDNTRNAGMARLALDVMAREPRNRATIWAHLAHLSREYIPGQRSMGSNLAAARGDAYRVYALLAVTGSARAWDVAQKIGVVAQPLRVPPRNSVEAALGTKPGITYWTFANATGDAATWLDGVHALREFGAVFAREGRDFSFWNLRSFDGAIMFATVEPSEPTVTGERHVKE